MGCILHICDKMLVVGGTSVRFGACKIRFNPSVVLDYWPNQSGDPVGNQYLLFYVLMFLCMFVLPGEEYRLSQWFPDIETVMRVMNDTLLNGV